MTTFPRVVTAIASSLTFAVLCGAPAPAVGQTATRSVIRDAATGKLQPTRLPSLTGIKTSSDKARATLDDMVESVRARLERIESLIEVGEGEA